MSFFGEVWLWSLAGFLVGAFLCWVLVARPAQRRTAELEDSLAEARRAAKAPAPQVRDRPFDDHDDRPSFDSAPSFDGAAFDSAAFDSAAYDQAMPERLKATLY